MAVSRMISRVDLCTLQCKFTFGSSTRSLFNKEVEVGLACSNLRIVRPMPQDRTQFVSRALRLLTQSLFPSFQLAVFPLPGASWTATRLLAGYMLLYDDQGVSLVYGELHAHCDNTAGFAAYEDDACKVQVVHLSIDTNTCVSERVGIDCSCFSLGDHHFSTRTCAEKMLWLRAISNVKVKLRHLAATPSPTELRFYRSAVREQINSLPPTGEPDPTPALLPRRRSNLSQLPRAGPGLPALPVMSLQSPKPDSGSFTGGGPNCQAPEPVALLKDRFINWADKPLRKVSHCSTFSRQGSNVSDGPRRKFHSWGSFQQSYELVAIGEDFERRCLHNHLLHQMQAVKDNRENMGGLQTQWIRVMKLFEEIGND
eukprot:Skav231847  [mRNA]  locus=scaffold2215:344412:363148:+ [translate_table: standard]